MSLMNDAFKYGNINRNRQIKIREAEVEKQARENMRERGMSEEEIEERMDEELQKNLLKP